jgi:hypothetical protein
MNVKLFYNDYLIYYFLNKKQNGVLNTINILGRQKTFHFSFFI